MKKISYCLLWFALIFACDTKININQPTIINVNDLSGVGEKLLFKTVEYVEVEGEQIKADSFVWKIDFKGQMIDPDSVYDNYMIWVPQDEGKAILQVSVTYSGNKTITVYKEITISITASSMQSAISGTWVGYYTNNYGIDGDNLTIEIQEDGHYIGDNRSDWQSALLWGNDIKLPCAKIIVEKIEQKKGFGKVYIPFGNIDNDPSGYCCEFLLEDLQFLGGTDSLEFKVQDFGCNFNNEFIRLKLKRK